MNPDIKQLQERIDKLEKQLKLFESSTTIPLLVDTAFRTRLSTSNPLQTSAKSASSENQAVNEAGAGTYNVIAPPDGFLKSVIAGTTYYLPYYL